MCSWLKEMKKRIIAVVSALAALAIAYGIGYFKAALDGSACQMNRDFEHWAQLAELDRAFLTNVVTRPSTLRTGTYVLETTFPGKPTTTSVIDLVFTNGRFSLPKTEEPHRNGMADTMIQNGNVVSWYHEGIAYEANAECVGLIDDNMIWGRIYGWNRDESIGVWRITPKQED
jgi:hypothetical protein